MAPKKLQVYVNNELWEFDVSEAEFVAATAGSKYYNNIKFNNLFQEFLKQYIFIPNVY